MSSVIAKETSSDYGSPWVPATGYLMWTIGVAVQRVSLSIDPVSPWGTAPASVRPGSGIARRRTETRIRCTRMWVQCGSSAESFGTGPVAHIASDNSSERSRVASKKRRGDASGSQQTVSSVFPAHQRVLVTLRRPP